MASHLACRVPVEDLSSESEAETTLCAAFIFEGDRQRGMGYRYPMKPEIDPSLVAYAIEVCKVYPDLALKCKVYRDLVTKETLLESLIVGRAPIDLLEKFCSLFPEASRAVTSDGWGNSPLHRACQEFSTGSGRIVRCLAAAFPQLVSQTDRCDNLPLHLLRRHYHKENADIVGLVEATDILLELFPEGLKTANQEGLTPLGYWLLKRTHPSIQEVFVKHISRLSSVTFPLNVKTISNGAANFFPSLSGSISNVKKLELDIAVASLKESEDFVGIVQTFVPQCTRLTSLTISFPSIRRGAGGFTHPLAEPVADLLRHGCLEELILKEGIQMKPEPIIQAIVNRPNSPLKTLDIRCFRRNDDMTQLIADVIAANSNLNSLAISNVMIYEQQPIFQAVARNTHLRSLCLPNIIISAHSDGESSSEGGMENLDETIHDDDGVERLSRVLQTHNTSLEQIRCFEATFAEMQGLEYKSIQYYTRLNRFGRRQTRLDSFTCADLVKLLVNMNDHFGDNSSLGYTFGILLECPVTWTACR